MDNASYIALSGMTALTRQMDVLAHNVANLNTTAFKAERPLFESFLADDGTGTKMAYVIDYGIARDTRVGAITPTGATLDFAIEGEGYFIVETDGGQRYTRNGRFQVDAEGTLVTARGHAVLDDGGSPIRLGEDRSTLVVSDSGALSTATGPIGQIAIVTFENEQMLRMEGDSLYTTNAEPRPVEGARVTQGAIESSNVTPIVEMLQIMETARRYQSIAQLIQSRNEMLRRAVDTLGSA